MFHLLCSTMFRMCSVCLPICLSQKAALAVDGSVDNSVFAKMNDFLEKLQAAFEPPPHYGLTGRIIKNLKMPKKLRQGVHITYQYGVHQFWRFLHCIDSQTLYIIYCCVATGYVVVNWVIYHWVCLSVGSYEFVLFHIDYQQNYSNVKKVIWHSSKSSLVSVLIIKKEQDI